MSYLAWKHPNTSAVTLRSAGFALLVAAWIVGVALTQRIGGPLAWTGAT